jgi:hypothetical protein
VINPLRKSGQSKARREKDDRPTHMGIWSRSYASSTAWARASDQSFDQVQILLEMGAPSS